MKLVLDTNIYLASLLASGLCHDLTQEVFNLKNNHQIFISSEINRELYNKIGEKKEILSSKNIEWLIYQINEVAISIRIQEKIDANLRDEDDKKILECAVAARADLIVTMDKDLLKLKHFRGIGIVHPKTFFYMLPGSRKPLQQKFKRR